MENGPGEVESLVRGLWNPEGQLEESEEVQIRGAVQDWLLIQNVKPLSQPPGSLEERLAHPGKTVLIRALTSSHDWTHPEPCANTGHVD